MLTRALSVATEGIPADRSTLFLYDEVADGFVPASILTGPHASVGDGFILASQTRLGRILEDRVVTSEALDDRLIATFPHLVEESDESTPLFIPVFDSVAVGVVVTSCGDTESREVLDHSDRIIRQAQKAARAILDIRPDVDHWCRFRQILEVDPGGIAVIEGPENTFSYANAAFRQCLYGDIRPLLGRALERALPSTVAESFVSALRHTSSHGSTYRDPNFVIRDPFGSRHYELHLVPETVVDGGSAATFILLWDRTEAVTVRSSLENSVRQAADSESLLSADLDSTDNGFLVVGTSGDILYANTRLAELFGHELSHIRGSTRAEFGERVNAQMEHPSSFMQRDAHPYHNFEERSTDEVEMKRPIHRILSRFSGPVYKGDGTLLGKIEVYTDVTQVRQLQRNKDEFLSVVSHELRTPITSIKGYAQLLSRRAVDVRLPASTQTAYRVIERQATRMQELIGSLLDLSRLDTNMLHFEDEDVNLTELLRHVVQLVAMVDESRTIDLAVPDRDVWLRGDERRLEQVFTNLLANGLRYSPGGEAVTVSLSLEPEVRVSVRDKGIGIPPEALGLVFDRFYRGPGMTDLTGMGIGLYISKTVVEQHGGAIEVDSEMGKGSKFTVVLPLRIIVER